MRESGEQAGPGAVSGRGACSEQEGQGSQPSEDVTRSVTSGSHQHCLFLGYSAPGSILV